MSHKYRETECPLGNWMSLLTALPKMDEDTAWRLLKEEQEGEGRKTFIDRLYGRANQLREQRERKELHHERREV